MEDGAAAASGFSSDRVGFSPESDAALAGSRFALGTGWASTS